MKVLVELGEEDLVTLRKLDTALNKQLGNVYTGTNSMVVYFDYPPELVELLRPFPRKELADKLKTGKMTFELSSTKPQ